MLSSTYYRDLKEKEENAGQERLQIHEQGIASIDGVGEIDEIGGAGGVI